MVIETIITFFCLYSIKSVSPNGESSKESAASFDIELVRRCKSGDRKSFNELMIKNQKRIFNIMYRFCGDYEDARDLTQDVFVKVYKSLKTLKEDKKFKSWIITIATNTYKNRYKYLKSRGKGRSYSIDCPKELEDSEVKRDLKDCNPGADELVHKSRVQKIVQDKISLLKDDYKEVIVLRDIDGLSYEEISAILSISIGTVKSRIFRARDELKRHLSDVIDHL
jgi:RNA polymerase sigma-70 factor (ECF subfamily)